MTEIAQVYLGNVNDNPDLAQTINTNSYLELRLEQSDRQKGRIHAHSDSGMAIGIIKNRDLTLRSGDIFQTDSGKLVLINLQQQELLVLDFSAVDKQIALAKLVYLGHVLGNQHYPIKILEHQILVQLTIDKLILEKLIKEVNIKGLIIKYQTRSENEAIAFC
ncbi:MAG: urease accessory protein UreE [Cyanobacteria bacterium P01_C01_bin.72]